MRTAHPEIKIMIVDDDKEHLVRWTNTILGDDEAAQYVSGFLLFIYMRVFVNRICFFSFSQLVGYFLIEILTNVLKTFFFENNRKLIL